MHCSERARLLGPALRPLVASRAGRLPLESSVVGQPHPEEVVIHLHYPPAAQCLMPDRLVSSQLQEYVKDDIHSLTQGTVLSSFSLLSSLPHHTDSMALHGTQWTPHCPTGTVLLDHIVSLDLLLSPLVMSEETEELSSLPRVTQDWPQSQLQATLGPTSGSDPVLGVRAAGSQHDPSVPSRAGG